MANRSSNRSIGTTGFPFRDHEFETSPYSKELLENAKNIKITRKTDLTPKSNADRSGDFL